jgi:phosphoribosylamine--glycine ligase
MKILVVGGGGREHAIATALARNTETEIISSMSRRNPGIGRLAGRVLLCRETDVAKITAFAQDSCTDYAFIGPEAPLEAGIVDALLEKGIPCIGPTQAAARLETDKGFCRDLMIQHRIEGCPKYRIFDDPEEAVGFIRDYDGDLVIKPIGLTGGKGVRIMGEQVDREGAIAYARTIHGGMVIEERLIGEEFTLQAFVDGNYLIPMPLVQDHKRAFEGDTGPNTGGMGSYTMPDHMLPFVSDADRDKAIAIMRATVAALEWTGSHYKGILYGQFMNTRNGPRLIEYNARFGDPEAMNVLSLLDSDLSEIVAKIADGTLSKPAVSFAKSATVCKYLVPEGYPDAPRAGELIHAAPVPGALLYYASVEEKDNGMVTQSSRTLAFVGIGDTLEDAEAAAEAAASQVTGPVYHRRDIGTRAVLERRIAHMRSLQ